MRVRCLVTLDRSTFACRALLLARAGSGQELLCPDSVGPPMGRFSGVLVCVDLFNAQAHFGSGPTTRHRPHCTQGTAWPAALGTGVPCVPFGTKGTSLLVWCGRRGSPNGRWSCTFALRTVSLYIYIYIYGSKYLCDLYVILYYDDSISLSLFVSLSLSIYIYIYI